MKNSERAYERTGERERVNALAEFLRSEAAPRALQRVFGEATDDVREFFRRWGDLADDDGGSYLTVAAVASDKRERQVGRLDSAERVEPERWLRDRIVQHLGDLELRLRLRLWGTGGRPEGSLTASIEPTLAGCRHASTQVELGDDHRDEPSRPGGAMSEHDSACSGCARLERQLAGLSQGMGALSRRVHEADELGAAIVREVRRLASVQRRIQPVVDESANGVVQLSTSIRELFEMLEG